jgi:hypothetical protein
VARMGEKRNMYSLFGKRAVGEKNHYEDQDVGG